MFSDRVVGYDIYVTKPVFSFYIIYLSVVIFSFFYEKVKLFPSVFLLYGSMREKILTGFCRIAELYNSHHMDFLV